MLAVRNTEQVVRTWRQLMNIRRPTVNGLTDAMREDYMAMRELALRVRVDPEQGQQELQKFVATVQKDKNTQKELQLWDSGSETEFLSFSGRILKEARIFRGKRTFDSHPQSAKWAKETRSGPYSV